MIILVYMSLEEYIDAQLTLIGWNHLFSFCLSSVLQHSVAFCSFCGVFSFKKTVPFSVFIVVDTKFLVSCKHFCVCWYTWVPLHILCRMPGDWKNTNREFPPSVDSFLIVN